MLCSNILFLVIDGFRSDSCFGPNKNSKTPNLDSIIKLGSAFTNASGSAYQTMPSMSSVLTSMYPHECLIEDNKTFDLNPHLETYISHLSNLNYNTYAFLPEALNKSRIPSLFGKNIKTYSQNSTISTGNDKVFLEHFKKIKTQEPWFFYLHIYDLYVTFVNEYDKPDFLEDEKLGKNKYERILSNLDLFFGKLFDEIDFKNTILVIFADHGNDRGAYDKNIDDFVSNLREGKNPIIAKKKLINKLTPGILKPLKHKLGKKYLSIVKESMAKNKIKKMSEENLSIHEKRLINSAIFGVTHLFDDRFHIPVILIAPQLNKQKKIKDQISTIDIFPTIFDIIGHSEYNINSRGKTLLPLINENGTHTSYAFIDSIGNNPKQHLSNLIGIRTLEYKYWRNRNNKTKSVSLYNLEKDPLEEINIAQDNPKLIEKFENILSEINPSMNFNIKTLNIKTDKQSEDVEKDLRKLGYI